MARKKGSNTGSQHVKSQLFRLSPNREHFATNAVLGYGKGTSLPYIRGYQEAADILIERLEETGRHADFLVFPIVYLFRHYLELLLKELIYRIRQLYDLKPPAKEKVDHKLHDLWETAKPLLAQLADGQDISLQLHAGDRLFREFQRFDAKGESFRYAILPNDGRFPDTFPQSAGSCSRRLEAVALFDFAAATPRQFVEQFWKSEDHFSIHHPATLALVIRSERIASGLITYEEATAKLRYGPTKIPHLEVWCARPIPFDLVEAVILLREDPFRFKTFSPRNPRLADPEKLMRRTRPLLSPPRTPMERRDSYWSDYWRGLSKRQQEGVARALERIIRDKSAKAEGS